MKKIKFLHAFVVVLLIFFTFSFFTGFYIFRTFKGRLYLDFLVISFVSLLIIFGLLFLQRAFYIIIKKGFFSLLSVKRFKISGLFFIFSGFCDTIFNIVMVSRTPDDTSQFFFTNFNQGFLIIMIGFGLFIFADVIQNGSILKQENELTI